MTRVVSPASWRHLAVIATLIILIPLSACADFERRLDLAFYGTEEKARIANEELAAGRLEREISHQRNLEKETGEFIDDERKRHNAPAVPKDMPLQGFARLRAKEIADNFSEQRPNGDIMHGEFRLRAFLRPQSVVYEWMTTLEARQVLLNPKLARYAVGVFKKGGTYFWVLVTNDGHSPDDGQ